jgi:hypothetical protein
MWMGMLAFMDGTMKRIGQLKEEFSTDKNDVGSTPTVPTLK